MSLYTCTPAPTLNASSEELKTKGVQGLKCSPSVSVSTILEPTYSLNLSEANANAILRACLTRDNKKAYPGDHESLPIGSLPDLSLPLPKVVFAAKRPVSKADETKYKIRKYLAGRSKFKYIYTFTDPTTIPLVKALKIDLEDDYIAPSGFCTVRSLNVFIAVRKTICTLGSVLYSQPGKLCSKEPYCYSGDLEKFEWKDGIPADDMGGEITLPCVEKWGSPQGISPRNIPNVPDRKYLFFPYFRGMCGSDKLAIRRALHRASRGFDKDAEAAARIIQTFMSVGDKAFEGEQGRAMAHVAHITEMCYLSGTSIFSLISGGEYVGSIVIGSDKLVGTDHFGNPVPAVSYATIIAEVAKVSTSTENKERLARIISDLELDDEERSAPEVDKESVEPEALSSSYMIWWYLTKRSKAFESHEDNKRAVHECVVHLDFSQDVRREFTASGFDFWAKCLAFDDYLYDEKSGSNKFMNLEGINYCLDWRAVLGVFGGISYSPIWPGGARINIPAEGAEDPYTKEKEVRVKKGDKVEVEKIRDLDSLVFVRCPISQAMKDWEQVIASGAIWKPTKALARKEKLANMIFTGDSFATVWESLKSVFHKEGKAKGKGKEVAGPEVKEAPMPLVDVTKFSAF